MQKFLTPVLGAALGVLLASGPALAADITGAGATFPYPLYAKWAQAYKEKTKIGLNYQSIGSGGGIKQIKQKTVDFGASDMPLKPEELEKAGLIQFPAIMGGVVPVVNVPGVKPGELKLSGDLLSKIFLGQVKKWNDPAIRKLNPSLALPDKTINVVHRSDGSGTTFLFTEYLSKVSPDWQKKVGANTSVSWPTGVGGKGNEGVASYVKTIPSSIGYVEFAYALQSKMTHVQLQNSEGEFIAPDIKTFQAAASNADWQQAPGFYLVLTNQPGKESWPITGASFILMHKNQSNAQKAQAVLNFFDWAYESGDQMATQLDYVPMPDIVVKLVEEAWTKEITAAGKPVWPAK